MRYDFTKLSGADFEELVHDLLQTAWRMRLEIFGQGRDGGVDLRAWSAEGGLVVQCRNYRAGSYPTLRARMRDEELPKVDRLRPARYVLATSLELTVGQKDELTALLRPHVLDPADVISGTELERMLEEHPEVVRRHHKLWMSSVAVLERVLHAAEQGRTRAHVDRLMARLPLYVQTDAYARAMETIGRDRVVIVSGAPGVGKTTLADMLLYAHMADGFAPAVIRANPDEGRRLASSGTPTIFHFDDFLGQTFLGDRPDFLGRKEDADLVEFIDWVREGGVHRFVLTTREHVLSDAVQRSERLRHAGVAKGRCLVSVGELRRSQRARILYNHVFFSDLPEAHRRELLRDDFFLEIVDSDDFNPRLVEWLASHRRLGGIEAADYQAHVRGLLEDPHEIWRHAHRHEISQAARDLLATVHSFTRLAHLDDVERSFSSLHAKSIARLNRPTAPGAFRAALKELDGSFLEIREGTVDFINPSVRDFVSSVLEDDPALVVDVATSAVRFSQVVDAWRGSEPDGPYASARGVLAGSAAALAESFERTLDAPPIRWSRIDGRHIGRHVDMAMPDRVETLLRLRKVIPELASVAEKAVARLALDLGHGDVSPEQAARTLRSAWANRSSGDWTAAAPVVAAVAERLDCATAADWLAVLDLRSLAGSALDTLVPALDDLFATYREDLIDEERLNCSGADELETLRDALAKIQQRHGVDLKSDIHLVEQAIADAETELAEPPAAVATSVRDLVADEPDDEQLRRMFSGLVE